MTKEEFFEKWDREVEHSQSACNPLALLNHAKLMLADWHAAGGDWRGEECANLKFFIYQIVYLVFGHEMAWDGWSSEYDAIEERIEERSHVEQIEA